MTTVPPTKDQQSEYWRTILTEGHRPLKIARRVFRHMPSPPRCKVCLNPFGGPGGRVLRLAGWSRSRKNPNVCSRCCDDLPPGGADVDLAVLFVDLRGSTGLGERAGATAFAGELNRFYSAVSEVLLRHDALIDKLIGDEVMGLFIPGVCGPDYRRRAADAGLDVARVVEEAGLRAGVAVNAGIAFAGNVGSSVVDFTALGDPINVAARLQSQAGPGEVVLAADLCDGLPEGARRETFALAGRNEPVEALVVRAGR